MALLTNRKFIHFNQKSSFDTALANEQIADWQIVFIKDARLIWTHGLYYSFDQRITNDIYHKLLALNEINVELVSQVDALQQTVYSFFLSGATANRPDDMELGIAFFDTDLDKPIWWDGTKWIDSEGNPAGARHSGTTAQRPTGVKAGFMYYDTTIGKVLNYNGTSWIETGLTETEVENIVKYNSKEVEEYNGTSSFPPTGEDGIVYVDTSTTPPTYYTWNGTTYVPNSNAINQVDWNESDTTSSQYIKNKPSSLPASDVYSWAKAATKPSYTASEVGAIDSTTKGSANGVAELDANGKVPSSQLPSYVDDVIDLIAITDSAPATCAKDDLYYNTTSNKIFKATAANTWSAAGEDPESGKIYINTSDNKEYRWSGSTLANISSSLALGETSSTAYRGDRGKTAYDHSQSAHARTDATKTEASETNGNIKINGNETAVYTHPGSGTNPHGTTKSDVGLGNVGNFKAVSTEASQGLTDTEKSNARANIGASPEITDITNLLILDLFGGSSIDPSQNPNVITSNDVVSTTKNGVVPKTTAAVKYLQTDSQGVASWGDLPTDTDTKYKLSVNGTLNGDSTGTDLGSIYAPSTAGTSGQFLKSNGNEAPVWSDKPNYNYGEINYLSDNSTDYTINNSSATLSIDGTQPLQVVTTTTNIAGIIFSALPADGHSCHLIITAASALTVDIAHNATMITIDSTAYTTVCPEATAIDTLEITAGGYVELDLLRVGTKIYVRGV